MARNIPSPIKTAQTFIKYRLLQPFHKQPFLPKFLVLYVSYRCNARCVMCGIWENQASYPIESELTLEELNHILADPLFRDIERLNINGGELSLRTDLPQVMQVVVGRLPKLRHIIFSSNGMLTDRLVSQVRQIKEICDSKNISMLVTISVHGVSDIEDKIYGIKGVFDRQVKTLEALSTLSKELKFDLGLYCVVSRLNVDNLQALQDWVQAKNLSIGFSIVEKRERFDNLDKGDQFEIPDPDKVRAAAFFRQLVDQKSAFSASAYTYDYIANYIQYDQRRTMSCEYSLGGVILGSQGELYYCPHGEEIGNCRERSAYDIYYDSNNLARRESLLIHQKCLYCPPREVGPLAIQVDFFKYLKFSIQRLFANRQGR